MSFVPELSDFLGEWRISRLVEDRLSGQQGRFEGQAWFRPDGAFLKYREEGQLRLGGGPAMTAVRDYVWRQDGNRIAVDYGDGRSFHDFNPADPAARHHCEPDDYRVRYDFTHWPEWRAEWTVTGPRKDYTMISRYSR
ncbi:MAG: trigger factor [Rhodobacteraceae bacterium]|nr:trigger factor [Paracoccaceae bacterium]